MGTPKQLLPLGDKPVIRHCADTLVASGIEDLVVVTGTQHEACVEALQGTLARFARNEDAVSHMADSVRTGLRSLDAACSGVLVYLADHPFVSAETCSFIVDLHQQSSEKIIIPAFRGRRGHPSLFPIEIIKEIYFTDTLRDLIRQNEDRIMQVEVPDEGIVLDMDTQEDYRAFQEKYDRQGDKSVAESKKGLRP
jgi:CTP:molybdopterin cytidylyltransferase MocA